MNITENHDFEITIFGQIGSTEDKQEKKISSQG